MKAETDVCVFFTKFIHPVLRNFVSFSTRQITLIRRKLVACLYEFFKHHCLVCLSHFSVLAMKCNCLFFFIFIAPRYLKFCFIVNHFSLSFANGEIFPVIS